MKSTEHPEVLRKQKELEETQALWIRKRLELEAAAEHDPQLQVAIRKLCAADPFFWFDYFAWTYDPRQKAENQVVPFILWDYQKDLITWLKENIEATMGSIERRNLAIEKSRDMGASWVVILFIFWWWQFHNGSFLLGSRKQEEVDVRGDLDTMFGKLRFNLERQPKYLMPPGFDWKHHDKQLCLINPTGGEITGESSAANFARGGRKLAIVFDEHAAMGNDESAWTAAAGSTNVRISVSTPAGPHNKFYRLVTGKDDEEVFKYRLHWEKHPIKGAGKSFDSEGKLTSPWYEQQKKTMSPLDIARELDINYATSIKGLVFPDYTEKHRIQDYKPDTTGSIIRVFDPGIRFYVGFYHVDNYGRFVAFREIYRDDAHIRDIGYEVSKLSAELEEEFGIHRFYDYGDPAGGTRGGAGQDVPEYQVLADEFDIDVDYGVFSEIAPRLRVKSRITAMHKLLGEFCTQKETLKFLVDTKHCPLLDEALSSGYRYKIDKYSREPIEVVDEQHPWEDAVDCAGYGIVGHLGLISRTGRGSGRSGWAETRTTWGNTSGARGFKRYAY